MEANEVEKAEAKSQRCNRQIPLDDARTHGTREAILEKGNSEEQRISSRVV
jgi:hypothetical protein